MIERKLRGDAPRAVVFTYSTLPNLAEGSQGIISIENSASNIIETWAEKLNGNVWVAVGVVRNPSISNMSSSFTTADIGINGTSNQMFTSGLGELPVDGIRFMSSPNIETDNTNQLIDFYLVRNVTVAFADMWAASTGPDWFTESFTVSDTYGRYPSVAGTRFHTHNSSGGPNSTEAGTPTIASKLRAPGSFTFGGDGIILGHGSGTISGLDANNYSVTGKEDGQFMQWSQATPRGQTTQSVDVARLYYLVKVA